MCLNTRYRKLLLLLTLGIILVRSDLALASKVPVTAAIEKNDIVVVAKLENVHRGSFSNPRARWGQLVLSEAFKGTPPGRAFRVTLPNDWGPPSLSARLASWEFWAFALFFLSTTLTIAFFRRFSMKWTAIALLVVLLFLTLQVHGLTFCTHTRITGWPPSLDGIEGTPQLWVVYAQKPNSWGAGYYDLDHIEYCLKLIKEDPDKFGSHLSEETIQILTCARDCLRSNPGN